VKSLHQTLYEVIGQQTSAFCYHYPQQKVETGGRLLRAAEGDTGQREPVKGCQSRDGQPRASKAICCASLLRESGGVVRNEGVAAYLSLCIYGRGQVHG